MTKITLATGIFLLTLATNGIANELDNLDIQLVDNSSQNNPLLNHQIVGCDDHIQKKELTCSKKPEEIILNKLPTSQQLDMAEEEASDSELNQIKNQLVTILAELSRLKKAQAADKRTINELRGLIGVISNQSAGSNREKLTIVQTGINRLSSENKHKKRYTATLIRKDIKEIEKTDAYVIIEVQENESLSTYAQAYYNDNTKYYRIYKANRDKIGESLQVIVGDQLKIPLQ
jgi:hypothetical protein